MTFCIEEADQIIKEVRPSMSDDQSQAMGETSQFVPVSPVDSIVFGAAGDLSLRKLIPSCFIVGVMHRYR